jgi:hypothetical protein
MSHLMSAQDRRTLFTGLGACLFIVLSGRTVPVWRNWRSSVQERLAASTAALDRAAATLTVQGGVNRARLHVLAELHGADSLTLHALGPAAGAAQLAAIVGEAADSAHAKLNSMQIRADTNARTAMSRSSVRLSATADVAGLVSLLETLESGAPLLVVRELTVTQGDPMSPDERPEQLRIDLVVEGMTQSTMPPPVTPLRRAP